MPTDLRDHHDTTHPQPQSKTGWWRTVGIIVGLELRQRIRTTRWKITVAAVFVILSIAVLGTMSLALSDSYTDYAEWSVDLYGFVIVALLFFGVVLAPTLAATAINGDRKDATLAVVQVTPVSNWQLAVGKLIGNWLACMALIGIAAPYLVWGIVEAPYGVGPSVLALVLLSILYACYGAIGLGFSALTARPAGSALLTQATVFFLVLGLPMLFGMLVPATEQKHEVVVAENTYADPTDPDSESTCRDVLETRTFQQTQPIWWLLAPNPLLVLADSVAAHETAQPEGQFLGAPRPSMAVSMAHLLSWARSGEYIGADTCAEHVTRYVPYEDLDEQGQSYFERSQEFESSHVGRSWYLGVLMNLLLGGIGLTVAARGLRVPVRKLPKGVRIA